MQNTAYMHEHKVKVLKNVDANFLPATAHIGISIDNPRHYGSRLETLLEWSVRRFSTIQINVIDSINSYNIQFNEGLSFNESLNKAHEKGKIWIEQNHEILKHYPSVSIFTYEDLKQPFSHASRMKLLEGLYAQNIIFKNLIDAEIMAFVRRRQAHESFWTEEKIAKFSYFSRAYILDELALMSLLNETQNFIEIYAGRFLGILKNPDRLKVDNLPEGLKNYPLIEVDFIRRKNSAPTLKVA